MKNLIKLIIFSCLFLLIGTKNNSFAQSTTEVSLTISPPIAYLHVAPGTSKNHTVILENSGNTTITVLPTLVDFTTDGKTGRAIVSNQLTFPYISLGVDNSVTQVTIPPHKKAQLTLYIDVPENADEKEYPLTVLFFSQEELSKNDTSIGNSKINAAIGSNLVVLVAKQNKFSKILEVLDANAPKIIDSFQKLEFAPLVQNNSFGATTASGSAKIVNWRKQTIAEFEIYPDTILGHNSRELRALFLNDQEQPEPTSFSFKPNFMFGPYQIITTLNNDTEIITQSVYVFYAIPIAIIFVFVIAIIISVYFAKNKNNPN